jgi:cell division protein FtsW
MERRPKGRAMTLTSRTTSVRGARPSSGQATSSRGNGKGSATGTKDRNTGLRVARRRIGVSALILLVVLLLCVIGIVMVGTASSVVSIATYGSPWAILLRELMWMAIGVIVLVLVARLDYRKLRRFSPLLLVVTFALLFIVLVPGLGVHAQGSSRWVGFGQLRMQPSELMKLAMTLFAADFVARRLDERSVDRRIIGPLLIVSGFACVLILAQPDMGTATVLVCITLSLLFVSGVRLGPVMKVLGSLVAVGLVVALISPYRRQRLLSFVDPSAHGSGSGYQVVQSLIGLGSGHLFGTGLGRGQQQWGYLPNAHTDFIFSVIGEELGIVGACLVVVLLGSLLWLGIRAATHSPDRFGGLLAFGIVAWIAAETLINIGAVVGVLPVTGIPLPFISFGGSSLVITMAAAGVLVNVARQGESSELSRLARVTQGGSSRPARVVDSTRRSARNTNGAAGSTDRSAGHGRDR